MSDFSTLQEPNWVLDQYGTHNLWFKTPQGRMIHAWVNSRPPYCDRGHYSFCISSAPDEKGYETLDDADKFPRYYMDLETAKREAVLWMRWRFLKEPNR